MAKRPTIAIIGAGSATFSAHVLTDICLTEGLHDARISLMDVDEVRLGTAERFCRRLADELDVHLDIHTSVDLAQSIDGADFVINTAQEGGHSWVEEQRSMAERHGYYRGARLHNFGQMLLMHDVCTAMEQYCPDAWLLQSSNPVFEGCTLMHRASSINVIGLCHGHYGYRGVASVLGLDPDCVSAHMTGFNHWIWLREFLYEGNDAYPRLDEWIENESERYWEAHHPSYGDVGMSRAAIHQYQLYGRMPIGDTPRFVGWWYHTDLDTKKRWFGELGGFDSEIGWGLYLEAISDRVSRLEKAAYDDSKSVTETIPPKMSGEQIVPVINAIFRNEPQRFQVNIPNRGPLVPGFPEDLVVEVEAVVDGAGAHGIPEPPFSPVLHIGAMVPRWREAETLVEAVREGDRSLLLHALLHDHRTRSLAQADELVADWLSHPRNKRMAAHFA